MVDYRSSGLERAWNRAPSAQRLKPLRFEVYDPANGLLHAPVEYRYEDIPPLPDDLPDDTWIGQALKDFVLGEFGASSSRGSCPPEFQFASTTHTSHRPAFAYLEACEQMVYSGIVRSLAKASGATMSEQLYGLLSDPRLGNKDNLKHLSSTSFSAHLEKLNANHQRLYFLLPSFPFKDQNPFRVQAPTSHVDIGDVALLVRLHALSLAMYQVHPFGVDWIIVSDGLAYAPIFRVSEEDVRGYMSRLKAYRELLNIYSTVHVIDLRDMCLRLGFDRDGSPYIDSASRYVSGRLRSIVKETPALFDVFRVLVRGIKWNINFQDLISNFSLTWCEAWTLLNEGRGTVPAARHNAWDCFDEIAVNASYEYAAMNLAMRFIGIFERFFPTGVRATTHAKKGQVAIPCLGSVMPWNGVAVIRGEINKVNSLSVEPLHKVAANSGQIDRWCLYDSDNPFYYKVK